MDKQTKICAVVGGIWGLISGIYYIFDIQGMSIAYIKWEYMFTQTPDIWKIIFLPAYLTYKLIFIPLSVLDISVTLHSPLTLICFLLLLLVEIVIPVLFGIGIILLAANLINKGKIVLKK